MLGDDLNFLRLISHQGACQASMINGMQYISSCLLQHVPSSIPNHSTEDRNTVELSTQCSVVCQDPDFIHVRSVCYERQLQQARSFLHLGAKYPIDCRDKVRDGEGVREKAQNAAKSEGLHLTSAQYACLHVHADMKLELGILREVVHGSLR
jgi:hypothetical protein